MFLRNPRVHYIEWTADQRKRETNYHGQEEWINVLLVNGINGLTNDLLEIK